MQVIRGGKPDSLNVFDLLVGDIVQLETGEILPVDGILFKANNISMIIDNILFFVLFPIFFYL